jgi:hypothetical protein
MIARIVEARYVDGYTLWLRFNDGAEGEVDLKEELWGPIFEPLKDLNCFRQFTVHPELHTIVWENGADFSPEFLRSSIRSTA